MSNEQADAIGLSREHVKQAQADDKASRGYRASMHADDNKRFLSRVLSKRAGQVMLNLGSSRQRWAGNLAITALQLIVEHTD